MTIYRTLIILIAFGLSPISLFGQDSVINSLENFVKDYKTLDTIRINRLTKLETNYYNKSIDKFGTYIKEIKESSLKLNYSKGLSRGYFYGSLYEQLKGNYLQALDEIYTSIDYAKKDSLYSQLAYSYGQLSTLLSRNTNYNDNVKNKSEALRFVELGLESAIKSKHSPTIHNLLIRNILMCVDVYDISKEKALLTKAKGLLVKAKENVKNTKDTTNLLDIFLQEGKICNIEGKNKEALQVLFKAKQNYLKFAPLLEGLIDGHIADAYYKLQDLKSAEMYYKKSVSENAFANPDIQLSLIQSAKDFYFDIKDYKNSLYYSNKYHNLKDSISRISNLHDFEELMLKYNTALKDKENQELKHQNQIKQRNLNFTIIALFILTLLIGLLTYLYRKLLHTKQELSTSNKELESSNHKKDVIFKIVSHDLKMPTNNLLTLTKKLDSNAYSITKEWIQDYSKKINLIVVELVDTVNNLLYWSNKEANQSAPIETIYVYDCIYDILDTFTIYAKILDKSIYFDSKNKDITIICNRIHFYTLVKNFLSNAIKYSSKANGKILISSSLENNKVLVSIEDNGVGISDETIKRFNSGEIVSESHLKGMGFKICKEIANNYNIGVTFTQSEQLGGSKIILTI